MSSDVCVSVQMWVMYKTMYSWFCEFVCGSVCECACDSVCECVVVCAHVSGVQMLGVYSRKGNENRRDRVHKCDCEYVCVVVCMFESTRVSKKVRQLRKKNNSETKRNECTKKRHKLPI